MFFYVPSSSKISGFYGEKQGRAGSTAAMQDSRRSCCRSDLHEKNITQILGKQLKKWMDR
jgi:hypothetical protein